MIGIFCPLSNLNRNYSVASCVLDQAIMLRNKGHKVSLIVRQNFQDETSLEIRRYLNKTCSLKKAIEDLNYLIVHDIYFIDQFYKEADLLNQVLKYFKGKLIVFTHSVPSGLKGKILPNYDNVVYASLSRSNIPLVAKLYSVPENQVYYIPNFIDLEEFYNLEQETKKIIQDTNLLEKYPIITLPSRTHPGKNPLAILKTVKELTKLNLNPYFLWINSFSDAVESPELIKELREYSLKNNLSKCWAMYSDLSGSTQGCTRNTLKDILKISDVFMFPTISEAGPLSLLEAAASNNLLVLNKDVKAIKEFYEEELSNYESILSINRQFGNNNKTIYHEDEQVFYKDLAENIVANLNNNKIIQAKHKIFKLSPSFVYFNYYLPLLK